MSGVRDKRFRAHTVLRQFIQSSYPTIKSSNPNVKLMVREAAGVEPKAFVRFGAYLFCLVSLGNTKVLGADTSLAWQHETAMGESKYGASSVDR